jgi:diguanylate cyclase (GGDEF)-like protein
MDIKVKSYKNYRNQSKFNLTLIYAIISMVACVGFSISFLAIGANLPAFIQLVAAFIFMTIVGILRRRILTGMRYLALLTSLAIVIVQSVFFFGVGYGFHYQLFALIVVIFLLFDFSILYERISIYVYATLTVITFYICEWFTLEPMFLDYLVYEKYYFSISIFANFTGMIVILYYLSTVLFSAKDQLYSMATTDALTGLYNRRTFMKRGEEFFKIAERGGNIFSVIIFDIDFFKPINDEYGHLVGDHVLKDMSELAKKTIRETDLLSRYGGEEFAIILPNTTAEQAYLVSEKLRKVIEEHVILINPYKIQRTISLGVMSYHYSISSFDDLIDKADKAMYKSKHSGKNISTLFEQSDPFYREKRRVYGLKV